MRHLRRRSAAAVLAGLATIVLASNGTDTLLETTGIFPSLAEQREHGFGTTWMLLLALGYRTGFAYLGGRVTARLAPSAPRTHVAALVAVGGLLGLAGTVATWGTAPAWFSVAVIVLTPLAAWLGGGSPATHDRREAPARGDAADGH